MPPISPPLAERGITAETEGGKPAREKFVLADDRPEYAPTPLAPYDIFDEDGMPYSVHTLDKMHSIVDGLEEQGHPGALIEFARNSLMWAVTERSNQNHDALHIQQQRAKRSGIQFDHGYIEAHHRAKAGRATTSDLLDVASGPHGLRAVEIAKLSHPLDWEATKQMDEAVIAGLLLDERGRSVEFMPRGTENRYKYQRGETDASGKLRLVELGRKRDFATVEGENDEKLLVVKRSSVIIRLDDDLPEGQRPPREVSKKLKNAYHGAKPPKSADDPEYGSRAMQAALEEIAPYMEEVLSLPAEARPDWLTPTITTYYCKNLNAEEAEYTYERPARKASGEAAVNVLGAAALCADD